MSVALLANSSFGTLIFLSFNTDRPVKFLVVIILVVQEITAVVGFHGTFLQSSSIFSLNC